MFKERFDVIMVWYQNDWGLYGRRNEMIARTLATHPAIRKIIHIEPPLPLDWLAQNIDSTILDTNIATNLKRLLGYNDNGVWLFTPHIPNDDNINYAKKLVSTQLFQLLKTYKIENFILWLYPPHPISELIFDLFFDKASLICCDIVDDHRYYYLEKDHKRYNYTKMVYEKLISRANICFTVSEHLKKEFLTIQPNIFHFPNAVDPNFLRGNYDIPDDIKTIQQPIIGYTGSLLNRIDCDLLDFLAKSEPNYSIVLIGTTPSAEVVELIEKHKNIHYLGPKKHTQIPNYVNCFKVCIIPHLVHQFTNAMDPLKLYNYLAIGKPVVSTPIASVKEFSDVISIAKTKTEFLEKIKFWVEKGEPKEIEKRKKKVSNHTWEKRVQEMMKLIIDYIHNRPSDISKSKISYTLEIKESPRVSIIILNYNRLEDTLECISSIYKTAYIKYQIIVVDNGSKNNETQKLANWANKQKKRFIYCDKRNLNIPVKPFNQEIIIISNNDNLGFAGGNNIGIKYALNCGADYIWLLNNDTIIDKNALIELVKLAETDKKIGLISSKLYCYDNPKKVQYNGEKVVYQGMNDVENELPKPTNFATGCSLFIRREFIKQVGFLDEDYFLYFEDNDITTRALKAGWKVYYNPYSKIYHKGGVSIGNWLDSPLSVYYATRNYLLYHYKHDIFNISETFNFLKTQVFPQLKNNKERIFAFAQGIEDFVYGKKGKAKIDFREMTDIIKKIEKEETEKSLSNGNLKEKFLFAKKVLILNPTYSETLDKFLSLAQAIFLKESLAKTGDHESPSAYYQEAEKLYKNGQEEEAIKMFNKALEMDPNFALAHNDLAFIYWQKKDVRKALYHLTKAIALAPEDRDIVWNCGQIMFGLGCVKDAYEVYKNYLQKHPDEIEIKQVVEEIERAMSQ